ncbi:MAG: YbdD/YjiX family protein [Nitrosomonadales bacterium]|nr:YbdD/YjiX family protein [Nitrosomonadales bacterium]
MATRLNELLRRCWKLVRELSGDDAYERYLLHHAACHAEAEPLSRAKYFRQREQAKWEGIRRCC